MEGIIQCSVELSEQNSKMSKTQIEASMKFKAKTQFPSNLSSSAPAYSLQQMMSSSLPLFLEQCRTVMTLSSIGAGGDGNLCPLPPLPPSSPPAPAVVGVGRQAPDKIVPMSPLDLDRKVLSFLLASSLMPLVSSSLSSHSYFVRQNYCKPSLDHQP